MEILYKEGNFRYLLENENVLYDDIVSNNEIAIEIAKLVLKNTVNLETKSYDSITVFYDTEEEIWIVSFCKKNTLGNCVSVAINKSDARIVKVWYGE